MKDRMNERMNKLKDGRIIESNLLGELDAYTELVVY